MDKATLELVRRVGLFARLTDEQVECIEPGEIIDLPAGTVLVEEGAKSEKFFMVLEGEIRLTRTYDRQTVLMGTIKAGGYTGETTMLLGIPWLALARVPKPAKIFQLDEEAFWRMLSSCHEVAREIFRTAANKMRNMEGYSQQREKLASLGTMAAGLAHELNNPAAAARRAASHLQATTDKVQSLLCQLSKTMQHDDWQHLLLGSANAEKRLGDAPKLDHLERSDRAESLALWLEKRGVADAWDVAPTFVSADVDAAWLEALIDKLPAAAQPIALNWLEARLNLRLLLTQVEQSTARIGDLVKAVKSYSYMDQTGMQDIDVHDGLESTLTMLGHKLKNMTVERSFDRTLPHIMAYGSELNQVWTNLIDNAIHAVDGKGKICLGTCREDNQILVEIVDNGAGIPQSVQAHMFEPFFTTKPVGTGTGLGLIISNRIIADRHGGEIEFESKPGETRFKVRLPILAKPLRAEEQTV